MKRICEGSMVVGVGKENGWWAVRESNPRPWD